MRFLWIGVLLLISGCASIGFQNQTNCIQGLICPEGPKIVPSATSQLVNLPKPNSQAVVAVYDFQDLTGQRKSKDNIASFSTAVTQGAVHILIQELRDAGKGHWFVVV